MQGEKNNLRDREIRISLNDLFHMFKKNKKRILKGSFFCALLLCLFTLSRPVKYHSEATFWDKGTKQGNLNSNALSQILENSISGGTQYSEAAGVLKSKMLVGETVKKLHLHGTIRSKTDPSNGYLATIRDNLVGEYANFRNKRVPVLSEIQQELKFEALDYAGETPFSLKIRFTSEEVYVIPQLDVKGKLGSPLTLENVSFVLVKTDEKNKLTGKEFSLGFQSLDLTTKILSRIVKIESDKQDKSLLRISFEDRNRHASRDFLNVLMSEYQEYLKKDNDKTSQVQLNYLYAREKESVNDLENLLYAYATDLSSGYESTGFPDSEKEMEFLAKSQQDSLQRILSMDLESKRLNRIEYDDLAYYNRVYQTGDVEGVNSVLNQVRLFRQQRDFIALAIRETQTINHKTLEDLLKKNLFELNDVREVSKDIRTLLSSLQTNTKPKNQLKIVQDQRLMVGSWLQTLVNKETDWKNSPEIEKSQRKEECESCKLNFIEYLQNLNRCYEVYEKIINDRIVYQQQNPHLEFQGISLDTSEELYRNYCKQINELQSNSKQYEFVLNQMQHPEFEISSLSVTLTDPISQGMIAKAANLALSIKDDNNRSGKELDRLKEELELQKKFLSLHLKHISELKSLEEEVYQEKLKSLQNVRFELINQQISILEKHLGDYVKTRLMNLKQERSLLDEHLQQLQGQMKRLPKKWASEQLIKQKIQLNRGIMEEVTKLVETKNITHHLESIQSAPLDIAVASILPKSRHLLLFVTFGGIFGGLMTFGLLLVNGISKGISASQDNLALANQHVSGYLSRNPSLLDADLETLRRLMAFLPTDAQKPFGCPLLIIQGKGLDYSTVLAILLSKKKFKVLVMGLSFDAPALISQSGGLLDFLEGKIPAPTIIKGDEFDRIVAGGISRYSSELLGSRAFVELLDHLKEEYDFIIGLSHAMPVSGEAEELLKIFDHVAVSISDESLQNLEPYIKLAYDVPQTKKVTFLIV